MIGSGPVRNASDMREECMTPKLAEQPMAIDEVVDSVMLARDRVYGLEKRVSKVVMHLTGYGTPIPEENKKDRLNVKYTEITRATGEIMESVARMEDMLSNL